MDALQLFRPIPEGDNVLRIGTLRLLRLAGVYVAIAVIGAVAAAVVAVVQHGGLPAGVVGALLGFVPLVPFVLLVAATHIHPSVPIPAASALPSPVATSALHRLEWMLSFAGISAVLGLFVIVWWSANHTAHAFRTGAMIGLGISMVLMSSYRFFARRRDLPGVYGRNSYRITRRVEDHHETDE